MRNKNLTKQKLFDISLILTDKEKKMLRNVGYILLSDDRVQSSRNLQSYSIKKRDDVLFLQLNS